MSLKRNAQAQASAQAAAIVQNQAVNRMLNKRLSNGDDRFDDTILLSDQEIDSIIRVCRNANTRKR